MARSNTRGLELTFHRGTKRWCKVILGKRIYFGPGRSPNDLDSYERALEKYRAHQNRVVEEQRIRLAGAEAFRLLQEHSKAEEATRLERERLGYVEDAEAKDNMDRLLHKQKLNELMLATAAGRRDELLSGRNYFEYMSGKPAKRPRRATKPAATMAAGDTVAELITAYLLHRKPKAEVAVRGVRGNKHDRLSDRGFNGMQNGLATLRKFAGARGWGGPTETEALLADYRERLEARLLDGTYTAPTPSTTSSSTSAPTTCGSGGRGRSPSSRGTWTRWRGRCRWSRRPSRWATRR